MKGLTFITLLLFIIGTLNGQSIKGFVHDEHNQPISYAYIILQKDGTFKGGTLTNNGNFELEKIDTGNYLLCVRCLGYRDICTNIKVETDERNLNIILRENTVQLNEVTVKAEKPMVQMKENKLIVNINNSLLKNQESFESLLRYIPGVNVTPNGIEIFGIKSPKILIDGKEIFSKAELAMLKPEDIKTIELSNSTAMNDASALYVINVITIKKEPALGCQLYNRSIYNGHYDNESNLFLIYNGKAIQNSIYFSAESGNTGWQEQSINTLYFSDKTQYNTSFNLDAGEVLNDKNLYYGINFQIDSTQSAGIQLNGDYDLPKATQNINSLINTSDTYYTNTEEKSTDYSLQCSANYKNDTKKSGNFSVILDYLLNNDYKKSHIIENNGYSLMTNKSNFEIYSLKSDYSYDITQYKAGVMAGVKLFRTNNGNTNYFNTVNYPQEKDTTNPLFNSCNKLDENSYSIYVALKKKVKNNFDLSLGLRYEYYKRQILDYQTGYTLARVDNFFFPNISLTYRLSLKNCLLFSYSSNINRQAYDNISSQNFYINPYLVKVGNPNLKPTIINRISISYVLENKIQAKIEYCSQQNYTTMFFSNNDSLIIAMYEGVKKQDINFYLNGTLNSNKLYTIIGVNVNKPFFEYEYLNETKSITNLNFTFSVNNVFSVTKNFELNFSVQYHPIKQLDLFVFKPEWNVEAGLKKYFFKKNFRLSMIIDYNSPNYYSMEYRFIELNHTYIRNNYRISLSLLYKLNFNKKWVKQNSSISEEKERIKK